MKRTAILMAVVCLFAILFCIPVYAADDSAVTPLNDFSYTLQPSGKLLLSQYTGKSKTVYVPGEYWIEGIRHPVEINTYTIFRGNQIVEKITLGEAITFYKNTAAALFAQCPNLRSVTARNPDSGSIVSMEYMFCDSPKLTQVDLTGWDTGNVLSMRYLFSGCKELKKIVGYQQWNTEKVVNISFLFNNNQKLETVDLRNWDLSAVNNSSWCFQNCYASKILLPDSLAVISAGFLNHAMRCDIESFTVPAGVKTIGYAHTFYDFATDRFQAFRVAQDSSAFCAIDGILYSGDGRKLLAIPRNKEFFQNTYEIPEGVDFLSELSFSRNYNIKRVILPNSYLLKTVPLYDSEYITFEDTGNLNEGLNLNIAIYLYTGITEYAVKEDNPNYSSYGGVIYSKDMTTLLAVPTRYKGYLDIPEGVKVWRSDAMWCGTDTINGRMQATGVHIPASMTDIAPGQMEKLNWLKQKVSGFRITVSKDNPVYYINRAGQLTSKPILSELDIQIQTQDLVYDGTPKQPQVTITYKNKTLKQGEDYTLTYTNNVSAGTASVQITGISGFYGTAERSFLIAKATPEYTPPQSVEGVFGQLLQELPLPEGFRFAEPMQWVGAVGENTAFVTYSNNDINYRAVENIPVTVYVKPKEMIVGADSIPAVQVWTGEPICPNILVADGGVAVPQEEYTATYTGNQGFGRATITITDTPGGNFTVSGTLHFWIVPDPVLVYLILLAALTVLAFVQNLKNIKDAQTVKQPKNR